MFEPVADQDGDGFTVNDGDCDDTDNTVYPNAPEICDGQKNDCDAVTYVDGSFESWFGDACDGGDSDLCEEGTLSCVGGVQSCSDTTGDDLEVCDGVDNDCNPSTADGSSESWFGDACDGVDSDLCEEGTLSCVGGVQSCSDTTGDDLEICDGVDNDCDGEIDEWLADIDVSIGLPECACDSDEYELDIEYMAEGCQVDGSLRIWKNKDLVETIILDSFSGTANYTMTASPDLEDTYTWEALLEVDGAGQADDEASLMLCETPPVGDIPDQVSPFVTFNLDQYLTDWNGPEVSWSATEPPEGWTVDIDDYNEVTVTAPDGATEPAIVMFTGYVECCTAVFCSDSDEATFIPSSSNQAPDCAEAYADSNCLWPPDNKFLDVSLVGVTDPDGDEVSINIVAITSDEATASEEGAGDQKHSPDASGIDTDTASLRAERSGEGDGRVYVIDFLAEDGKGGECEGSVAVNVPHDRGSEGCTAIDSGQLYDATGIN
jgi:hypothetical protein